MKVAEVQGSPDSVGAFLTLRTSFYKSVTTFTFPCDVDRAEPIWRRQTSLARSRRENARIVSFLRRSQILGSRRSSPPRPLSGLPTIHPQSATVPSTRFHSEARNSRRGERGPPSSSPDLPESARTHISNGRQPPNGNIDLKALQ
jgi:hypothetical protein